MTEYRSEPTLGEVNRNVTDIKNELRAMRGELVRSDVYLANRQADDLRMKAIEVDVQQIAEDRSAMRRLVYGAVVTGVGSLIVQAVASIVGAHS